MDRSKWFNKVYDIVSNFYDWNNESVECANNITDLFMDELKEASVNPYPLSFPCGWKNKQPTWDIILDKNTIHRNVMKSEIAFASDQIDKDRYIDVIRERDIKNYYEYHINQKTNPIAELEKA